MKDIIVQFEEIPTTCISDAMQGMNNFDPKIKPLKESYKVVGRAFTVKMPVSDNEAFLRALSEATPEDVLVVDAKGDTYRGFAGDFVVGMAKALGIKGIVADGVIRDIQGIKALDYPVFCKGTTVAASFKHGTGEINVPISCGGVAVCPGDIIVGDADGVVVIPKSREEEVLLKAQQKFEKDKIREQEFLTSAEGARRYLDSILSK